MTEEALPPLKADNHRPWVALGSEDYEAALMGNAEGLQALSKILERCASESPEGKEYRSCGEAERDLLKLTAAGSELALTRVDLLQQLPARPSSSGRVPDKVALVGWALAVFLVSMVFLAGLGVITGLIPVK
jgi:hypothetical protein